MAKIIRTLTLLAIILTLCCEKDKNKPVHVTIIPTVDKARLEYHGYVSDAKFELASEIHKFSRLFVGQDTVNGQPVNIYVSQNKKTLFYTDKNGDVWSQKSIDISSQLFAYGLKTDSPVIVKYWHPHLKISDGKDSKWSVLIDTTFNAYNAEGKEQQIQFYRYGEAMYDGWSDVYVQYRRDVPYRCINAYWPVLNTFIINHTTGDSLLVNKGNARQMFEPTIGAIKYTNDYTLSENGEAPVVKKGTWELTGKYIPQN